MRRTDRLYALVEELRARAPKPVTRSALAERFEVTARTIERDVLALQEAGVPIWTQRGRGGGYAIDAAWSLPPLNFNATEALAVIAALAAARSLPFADAGRRAEQKILSAMRADQAARARDLAARFRMAPFAHPARRDVLRAIEEAIVGRKVLDLHYRDRDGIVSSRSVEAHGVHLTGDSSYLLGWCRLRDDGRTFRLDRIVSAVATDEEAPPRDIDPMLTWSEEWFAPEAAGLPAVKARTPGRSGGPPRRVDDRSGSSAAFAVAVARRLPGVHDPAALVTVDGDTAVIDGERIDLSTTSRDDVRDAIERTWQRCGPRRRRPRRSGITIDDIREIAMTFPETTEGTVLSTSHGFLVRKKAFVRVGPPVGNLRPPDDEDAVHIRYTDQRPMLLEQEADRFFITPHYGDPAEPGGVLTRLSENMRRDLPQLAELIEESWRHYAPPRLVTRFDGA